ncbi:multidrug effflux MFS transporter [Saprospira sp. CCB-QB6]|uniref:multidrug effflux MFS transporter n=1 Tax=Saprospira sp. CCB-QB6 TaxID=3023936 RepID=UPI003FA73157
MWAVLGLLMAFTSLSVDIYLPAMPLMHNDLQGDVELTITGFLLGFSIAQLIWGPISDRVGRKWPLLLGLILFVIGSVGCALADNIVEMIIWRVIQAFGACVGPMLSRAMIRDLFGKTKAAETLSVLMVIMAIAPIAAPLIGGQMIKFTTWHSMFWLLAVIGAIMALSVFGLPETLAPEKRQADAIHKAFSKYMQLLVNKKFMYYTLCVTFFYVAVYAFVAGSPNAYISYYGVDPAWFGAIFAINIIGMMGLSLVNRALVSRFHLDRLILYASSIAAIASLLLVPLIAFDIGGIYGLIIPVFIFFSMNGIIAASTTAAALDDLPKMAGAASAFLGALQYGSGVISTVLLSIFEDPSPLAMSAIIAFFTLAAFLMIFLKMRLDKKG